MNLNPHPYDLLAIAIAQDSLPLRTSTLSFKVSDDKAGLKRLLARIRKVESALRPL